jgi:hypothetical protein
MDSQQLTGDTVDDIGEGSLKLIAGVSARRALASVIVRAMRRYVRSADLRTFGPSHVVVFTEKSIDALRDRIAPLLDDGETLIVVEFERWSAYGPSIDARWLSRRGH